MRRIITRGDGSVKPTPSTPRISLHRGDRPARKAALLPYPRITAIRGLNKVTLLRA